MSTHTCPDCDVAGDGKCSHCHGKGKVLPDKSFGKFHTEIVCSRCKGSCICPTCGGAGEVEIGGEAG